MTESVRDILAIAISGTSLTTGRLQDWSPRFVAQAKTQPECVGPVVIWNMGRGGWTSTDILANVPNIVALKPRYVLTESGSINDCFDGGSGPQVSLATHDSNLTSIITDLRAGIPGVDVTIQTMSPVSTSIASGRPDLATYYAHDLSVAAGLGAETIDNYAGWPKPLDPALTYDSDGLHPIWAGADEVYLYPNVRTWLRAKMTEFWEL